MKSAWSACCRFKQTSGVKQTTTHLGFRQIVMLVACISLDANRMCLEKVDMCIIYIYEFKHVPFHMHSSPTIRL